MEEKGCVNMKFIVFLKGTLGKMVGTNMLDYDFINLQFWQTFPQKFYNIKSYDSTKEEFEKDNAVIDRDVYDQCEDNSVPDYDVPDTAVTALAIDDIGSSTVHAADGAENWVDETPALDESVDNQSNSQPQSLSILQTQSVCY